MIRWIVTIALALALAPLPAMAEEEGGMLDALFSKEEPKRAPLPWELPRPGEETCMPEELVLLRQLRERSTALDARERALELREEAAADVEERLAGELTRLEELRAGMVAFLERASDVSEENVAALAKMVDSMKARDAAPMLTGMDDDVVLEVLRSVKPKQAARILGALAPDRSRALGDRFTLVPDPRDGVADGVEQ